MRNIAEVQSKMFNVYSKVLLAWGRYLRVQWLLQRFLATTKNSGIINKQLAKLFILKQHSEGHFKALSEVLMDLPTNINNRK